MKKTEELVVITKTYDLIVWSCNHTRKFPRNHRFVLGERLERNLHDLLETLIRNSIRRLRSCSLRWQLDVPLFGFTQHSKKSSIMQVRLYAGYPFCVRYDINLLR